MPIFDLSGTQLTGYRSDVTPPPGLQAFWDETITQARAEGWEPTVERVDTGLRLVDTYDVTFSGFGGDPIRAWYHRPAGTDAELPIVVRYQGYGGGRGHPHQVGIWPLAGYACLEMDTRGQGSGHTPGDTADPAGSLPAHPGYLTRGILDPETYYYRRVFTDGVRAVDCARTLPGVDADRVSVAGGSQGGGISLAVAGLVPDLTAVLPDVPFLSDFRRASQLATEDPYLELAGYLAVHRGHLEQVFATLAHFDVSVLARTATAPALFSVGLMDPVCPPSTVYAAYNAYGGRKEIRVYPYNEHEGGQSFHELAQLSWLADVMPVHIAEPTAGSDRRS
ncbi:MAG: cephalosporin-C deacetylase [Pseudonocardiales bacterium]|jgi:cephalosporin-C deacetylase|nr:cephalosporin-C deacetylase [Pseudonocardiales bacterium]MDT4976992.1 cephalosporin-C deacetylase [Pseudonocardiales bacterium]